MKIAYRIAAPLASIAAATLLGCASEPPKPFVKDELRNVSATVEAIDPETRLVVLRGPNGPTSIVAGPEVRNFGQVRVGDRVDITYYEGIAAQVNKSGKTGEPTEDAATSTYQAPAGARPAGGIGQSVTTTVKIESVDTSFNTVTFKRPDGFVRTIAVESPEAKEYIRTLRPGDLVDIVYTEAVAVAVMPGK